MSQDSNGSTQPATSNIADTEAEQPNANVELASTNGFADTEAEQPKANVEPVSANGFAEKEAEQPKGTVDPVGANGRAGSQTSERKAQANRENAKHSTGPRTPAGRAWMRYNAIKHGFYTTSVVIRTGDAKESQEEFDILLEGLRRAWGPKDLMQERYRCSSGSLGVSSFIMCCTARSWAAWARF